MENIIGGSCFGHPRRPLPPSTQTRALVCWVAQVFPLGLPPASLLFPFSNPAIRRLFFPLTVPRTHSAPPFYCFFSAGSPNCFSPQRSRRGSSMLGSLRRPLEIAFSSNIEEPRFQQPAHQEGRGERQVNCWRGCSTLLCFGLLF